MSIPRPAVSDVSRSVARLDEHADMPSAGYKTIDGQGWTLYELRASVATNLAFQFERHNGWGGRRKVTTADVRAALIAHGASPFTVEQHARAIASIIRADFTDGRGSIKG